MAYEVLYFIFHLNNIFNCCDQIAILDVSINAIAARVGNIAERSYAVTAQKNDLDTYLNRARKAVINTAKQRYWQYCLHPISS